MEKVVQVHQNNINQSVSGGANNPLVQPAKIVNPFPQKTNKLDKLMNQKATLVIIGIVVVLLGVGTGKVLAGSSGSKLPSGADKVETPTITQNEDEAGISDVSAFADQESPEGVLVEGGIKGDGTHHLERAGGPTQYVYLSSTVLDLQSFVGKKVKVWGQTISGKSAGWLMDVVKVKVIQ